MDEKVITIVIAAYNMSAFVEVSLYGLAKLTKNKYKVIICDNGSSDSDKKRLKRVASKYENIELFFRKQSASGAVGHGEALDILIDKIDTPYGVILDADAIFLKKDWDEILINQLDDEVKVIGAPPVRHPLGLVDFPVVYAVLFDTEVFKSLGIDMRVKVGQEVGREMREKFLKSGHKSEVQDVGWEMREQFLKSGYKGKILEVRSTRTYKGGPFRNVICAEYYLEDYDDIFVCHFGRGSTLGAAKYKQWSRLLQLPYINLMARKIKGYRERKAWLAICKDIIDRQAGQ